MKDSEKTIKPDKGIQIPAATTGLYLIYFLRTAE
jgi:hypothetical protein